MITQPTVLILGAGASLHYGYPLGYALRDCILNFQNTSLCERSGVGNHRQLREFIDAFRQSRLYSIDAFLGLNTKYAEVGKLAIAAVLMNFEEGAAKKLDDGSQDWYDYLWNRIAAGHSWEELNFEKLAIVTFNYDRSLEAFLLSAVLGTYAVSVEKAIEKLRQLNIVHVYGDLGSAWPGDNTFREYGESLSERSVFRAAGGIKVIPEARDDESTFIKARQLLMRARALCFLGFGFDTLNLRRLEAKISCSDGIEHGTVQRTVVATCKGRTAAEAAADAIACGVYCSDRSMYPEGFRAVDCLRLLRETLILN